MQISVTVGERSVAHAGGSNFGGHLAELLQSFRGHLSKMEVRACTQPAGDGCVCVRKMDVVART